MCFYFTECLYLNTYFDYSAAKEYQYNIPYRWNCRRMDVKEVGREGKWTLPPLLKEVAFSSWLNKGTLQKCSLDQILTLKSWKQIKIEHAPKKLDPSVM